MNFSSTSAVEIVAGMLGSRRGEGSSSRESCAEISPLESLLQQAWLQSHRPKVQKRITSATPPSNVLLGRRSGPQSSTPEVSSSVGSQEGPEKLFFHKKRPNTSTVFIPRFAIPELRCYSQKTDVPQSVALLQWNVRRVQGEPVNGRSRASNSLGASPTLSSESRTWISGQHSCVTESGDTTSGSVDFEAQTQPLASYLDAFLMDENLEEESLLENESSAYRAISREISGLIGLENGAECEDSDVVDHGGCWEGAEVSNVELETSSIENSSAYQAMAKEIAELISPSARLRDASDPECPNEICVRADFRPPEEFSVRKIMEAYAWVLSKTIADGSLSFGNHETRISTETDTILMYLDDEWRLYLQTLNQNFTPSSNFDFNRLLCGAGSSTGSDGIAVAVSTCGSLTELLYRCALAVSQGNDRVATELLAELRQRSSPYRSPAERLAYYLMEALVAKLSGTGEQLYMVTQNNVPSPLSTFKATRLYFENCPYIKLAHFFSMKTVLEAFEGATRVHVVVYGIQYGTEFPGLMHQLAWRPGGPPHLRITGIDHPYPGNDPALKVKETGRRLKEFAKSYDVPFEFVPLAGNWESFTARDMNLRDDEVLAVCSDRLHVLLDESVMATSPRELVLRRIRSMNPKVFVFVGLNGGLNAPFFMTRFRETVKHFTAIFDGMEISMPPDDPDRVIIERGFFARMLLNIIACEGQVRIERAEPYRQWQNRLQRAGFTLRPLNPSVFNKITAMMVAFHKDYGVGKDDGWFVMGINNEIVHACSVWEPNNSSPAPRQLHNF